jgi:hypothetical protein
VSALAFKREQYDPKEQMWLLNEATVEKISKIEKWRMK